ncbi:MAG: DUF1508 domain-containing protein [Candidatus Marinimicrobia bacterium]|nr:DUF1508 domain-containing protein [Candidatus Neomarinimicrobiota bacterium]MCF7880861.1 DUF1508 domain-containing protein [Candidatus Neomarinimicrobiota bacterium]
MAEQSPVIQKNATRPEGQDYAALRAEGLEHIEKLGNKLWTDYNIHDPGITTLEMLCYAITDLSYRTDYPVEDLLAESGGTGTEEFSTFFTAREIFPCNPVTVNDYRKVLIDVPGVKNAWLEISETGEQDIYRDCEKDTLVYEPNKDTEPVELRGLYNVRLEFEEDPHLGNLNNTCIRHVVESDDEEADIGVVLPGWEEFFVCYGVPTEIQVTELNSIPLSQKYAGEITVEFSSGNSLQLDFTVITEGMKTPEHRQQILDALEGEDGLLKLYLQRVTRALEIASEVHTRLHARRNLCEDFYEFHGIDIEEIGVCADIEVAPDADIEKVLAEIYYHIGHFLAPPVRFYTIEEMLERGKTTDEIFEGPRLDHGFIDDEELAASEFRKTIHASDLIQIIMDIEGVLAVRKILLTNFYGCEPLTDGEEWCLDIGEGRATRLSIPLSDIDFYKGVIPYTAETDEMENHLRELQALDRHPRLGKDEYDLPIPNGESRDVEHYYSIQNDYPLTYGIGPERLPRSSTDLRKAQAKQLKGYLMFFEKILADYLSQLAHLSDLFSINPEVKRTYFTQPLHGVPGELEPEVPDVAALYLDFVQSLDLENHPEIDLDDFSTYQPQWSQYLDEVKDDYPAIRLQRDDLVEDDATYLDRRNRLLDHLMARFAEQFTDYVTLMFVMDHKKAPGELISDKIDFIRDYPEISHNRGKAFNYKSQENFWHSTNVSGLQRRVARLLGMRDFQRRRLSDCLEEPVEYYEESDTDDIEEFRFRLRDTSGNIMLSSSTRYFTLQAAEAEARLVLRYGREEKYYVRETTSSGRYYFNLTDATGEVIARRIEYFETEAERDEAIQDVITFISDQADCEGFHLVEHILLRPRTKNDALLNICMDDDCTGCLGHMDPYSFRMTVVIPYWPDRFQNMDFRRHVESTLRMEAPAHTHVKICWVDEESLKEFEEKYDLWLKEVSQLCPDPLQLSLRQSELLDVLLELRSVYPEAELHNCEEEQDENPLLLNRTILGSFDEE